MKVSSQRWPISGGQKADDQRRELRGVDGFDEMAVKSSIAGRAAIFVSTPTGQRDQDGVLAPRLRADPPCRVMPAQIWQADIQQNDIWLERCGGSHAFCAVTCDSRLATG